MHPTRLYRPILKIPEASAGKYSINHIHFKPGHEFRTTTLRTEQLGGQQTQSFSFTTGVTFLELKSTKHGLWMTDLPVEQAQCNALIGSMRGHVLVGGLGLGYAAVRLAQMPQVDRVTVVERSADVIALVYPHLPKRSVAKIGVVHADLFTVLENEQAMKSRARPSFDHAFYDIWQADGERVFFGVVLPLLRRSRGVVALPPQCWNEDVMRGQLLHSLIGRGWYSVSSGGGTNATKALDEASTYRGSIWTDWSVPFFQWLRTAKPTPSAMQQRAGWYAKTFGDGSEPLPQEIEDALLAYEQDYRNDDEGA